ncbi:hypothetical protein GK047_10925 [Paenibacillus sp. SYP-B3998]|uniref:ABC transporter ATP-binding protein n=1 Tax=Paenibacillus sp. SYP-B3998 TaxID=2678564 RepID=A0A6G3ZXV6_9BACL|nr:hypothetical protein [Paenibacillus sp. SYP-B3998]NEW06524.1 hypothetical protein [Paenibacillus sp. SYP-B3998]
MSSSVGGVQLHVRNVNKTFGAGSVLSGIDLNIKEGELVDYFETTI